MAKLLDPASVLIWAETLFIFLSTIPIFLLFKKKYISKEVVVFSVIYLLFNRGISIGALYPIHPTTWSVFAISLLGYSTIIENKKMIFGSLFFLMLFKEEYPFAGVTLGFYYAVFKKDLKFATIIWTLTIAMLTWIFYLYPQVFSPQGLAPSHGGKLFKNLIENPLYVFSAIFAKAHIRLILEVLIPLIPFAYYLRKTKQSPQWAVFFAFIPCLAIRVLSGKWHYHYMGPIAAYLLWILIPLRSNQSVKVFAKPKYLYCMLSLLLLLNFGTMRKAKKSYQGRKISGKCNSNIDRSSQISRALTILRNNPKGNALIIGNIIPNIADRPNIYGIELHGRDPKSGYHWALIEKKYGDFWPLGKKKHMDYIDKWRKQIDTEIIIDDEYVFLAKGKFSLH